MAALVAVVAVLAAAVLVLGLRSRRLAGEAARLPALERQRDDAREHVALAVEAADRVRRALDALPQGVAVVDLAGEEVLRNNTARELTTARHGQALVGGVVDDLLATALTGTGARRTLELYGPPARVVVVAAHPVPGGAVAVIDDVTEAHRTAAVRRDFVANLSHELKTPVGAIGLLAETLVAETDVEVARRLAQRVVSESFRVGRTIDELLELSRLEAGVEPSHRAVELQEVLGEAADRLRPAAEQRRIALRLAPVPAGARALGDLRLLVSAVANLLDNAVKYSEPGSAVDVRATSDGTTVVIEVEDHGLGIPSRDQERIFERFYRVDRARSRETGGTGLGLSIVRHVAAHHGGTVAVTSVEGHGSTFTLRLPAAPGPVAVTDPAADGPAPRRTA